MEHIPRVMLRPKICCAHRCTDGRCARTSGIWCAHKFQALGRYSCFMKFMTVADFTGDRARAAGKSVMSTLASALAFMSRSTSA